MRGDSLRDLYAKTLALLGLGVLAGAGALVDYWPVGFNLPSVGTALQRPSPVNSVTADAQLIERTAPQLLRRPVAVPEAPVVTALVALPAVQHGHTPLGTTVALVEPFAPPVDQALMVDQPLMTVAELRPDPVAPIDWALAPDEPPVYAAVEATPQGLTNDGDGLFTGAFKKTGTSIVKTSVRTGASIVDAVRAVGGVVRRALPN